MTTDLENYRSKVETFLVESVEDGSACPAFGAILPPALHDQARSWQHTVSDAGFAGLHWPADHGGKGLSREHTAIWSEECAKANVSPYLNLQGLVLAGGAIIRNGSEEQKEQYLCSTLNGDTLWCQLFSEPDAGSDLASLTTTATLDGDNWVVQGQKVWCSNGQHAQAGILMARTNPAEPGHRGISFFLIDMSLPGIDVRPLRQMTGDRRRGILRGLPRQRTHAKERTTGTAPWRMGRCDGCPSRRARLKRVLRAHQPRTTASQTQHPPREQRRRPRSTPPAPNARARAQGHADAFERGPRSSSGSKTPPHRTRV